MQCVFPIWKIDTAWLVDDFVAKGFKSYTCCINDGYLDESWAGRLINESFINELPSTVDPCGENGEFHSFCFDGPLFSEPISVSIGEKTYKPLLIKTTDHPTPIKDAGTNGFWFADIVLNNK
jgi:diphthamide synthase (EF-2-diphthine--ammonia ligase)